MPRISSAERLQSHAHALAEGGAAAARLVERHAVGVAQRLGVARAGGAHEGVVEAACLRRLVALVPAPALPAGEGERRGGDRAHDEIAVLVPPSLELGDLFLFLEI